MSNFANDHPNYLNLYTRLITITTKEIEQFFLLKKLSCRNISVAVPQFQVYNTLFAIFFLVLLDH